jgi:hypothetical protein
MTSVERDPQRVSGGLAGNVRLQCPSTCCWIWYTNRCIGKKRKVHGDVSRIDVSSRASIDSFGPDRVDEGNACSRHITERLCKLEELFERFVCRNSSAPGASTAVPQSPTLTASGSSEKDSKVDLPGFSSDLQSKLSIGDGIVSLPHFFPRHRSGFTNTISSVRKHGLQHLPSGH